MAQKHLAILEADTGDAQSMPIGVLQIVNPNPHKSLGTRSSDLHRIALRRAPPRRSPSRVIDPGHRLPLAREHELRVRPPTKCLTVIDEFTRECLAIDVAGSIRSNRVIEVLSKLVSVHGAPDYLRSDNGSEFVSRAVLRWLNQSNINTACIDPGKPWQNGSNESFNGKFRDECLSMQWFKNRIDAKILIEEFRRQFNEVRPHSSLEQLTPAEFKRTISTISPAIAIS